LNQKKRINKDQKFFINEVLRLINLMKTYHHPLVGALPIISIGKDMDSANPIIVEVGMFQSITHKWPYNMTSTRKR
jgi:hypothetical protein